MIGTVGALGCTVTYGSPSSTSPSTSPSARPPASTTPAPGVDRYSPAPEPPIDDTADPTVEALGDPTLESAPDPTVEVPHWL